MTAILSDGGRAAVATAMKANVFLLAIGHGLTAWDAVPEDPANDITALDDLIAWHRPRAVEFVVADVAGIWTTPDGGPWTVSIAPSQHLMFRFKLDFADLNGEAMREVAVHLGAVVDPGVPGGQFLLDPGDVTDPGTLFLADRFSVVTPNGSVEQTFLYVHSF